MKASNYLLCLALMVCLVSCSSDEPDEPKVQNNLLGGELCSPSLSFESMKKIDENTFVLHNQFEYTDSVKFIGYDYFDKYDKSAYSRSVELPCSNGIYSWTVGGKDILCIQQTKPAEFTVKFSEDAKKLIPNAYRYSLEFEYTHEGTRYVMPTEFKSVETGWQPSGFMFDEDTISTADIEKYFSLYMNYNK